MPPEAMQTQCCYIIHAEARSFRYDPASASHPPPTSGRLGRPELFGPNDLILRTSGLSEVDRVPFRNDVGRITKGTEKRRTQGIYVARGRVY